MGKVWEPPQSPQGEARTTMNCESLSELIRRIKNKILYEIRFSTYAYEDVKQHAKRLSGFF
jgi:hypothetical protein